MVMHDIGMVIGYVTVTDPLAKVPIEPLLNFR